MRGTQFGCRVFPPVFPLFVCSRVLGESRTDRGELPPDEVIRQRAMLLSNSVRRKLSNAWVRVHNILRSWDHDGIGMVTRQQFMRALAVARLYNTWSRWLRAIGLGCTAFTLTACARHVHVMCTACARHVHGMCTAPYISRRVSVVHLVSAACL